MALLNSDNYGDLAKVSSGSSSREPGKFFSIFITGAARTGQEYGKLQCMPSIDGGEYLINNAASVYFIPYFIKRYWEKYITAKSRDGKDYQKLVAQGWGDDVPKIDESCKFAYTIAGVALDPQTKKALVHPKDIEAAKIKKGDPVMIHFKCSGMKFDGAAKFIKAIADKAKNLPPLSDNIEFERNVVSPRRFICGAKVVSAKTDHGDKEVFEFSVDTQLPDKAVEQVMNSAMSFKTDFEKQFDKTEFVKSSGSAPKPNADAVPFAGPDAPAPESKPSTNEGDNFDLGF